MPVLPLPTEAVYIRGSLSDLRALSHNRRDRIFQPRPVRVFSRIRVFLFLVFHGAG